MIVVSDTYPITYLYQIARFGLLSSLYGEIVIPPAVERELRVAASLHHDLDWSVLRVVEPKSSELVASCLLRWISVRVRPSLSHPRSKRISC